MGRYLTTAEVADILAVAPDKVCDLIRDGQLTAYNLTRNPNARPRWRISPAALEQFLASRQSQPTPAPQQRRPRLEGVKKYF
jgi:excisionase family DNA binding protein